MTLRNALFGAAAAVAVFAGSHYRYIDNAPDESP